MSLVGHRRFGLAWQCGYMWCGILRDWLAGAG
jgi:hypothetical protein